MRCIGKIKNLLLLVIIFGTAQAVQAKDYRLSVVAIENGYAGQPFTFGLPFEDNDLLYSQSLEAKVTIGGVESSVPVQVDKKASFCSDNPALEFSSKNTCSPSRRYLRHAVVTTSLPTDLPSGQSASIVLSPSSGGGASSVLGFPSITVETQLDIGGTTWVADLASVPATSFNSPPSTGESNQAVTEWLSGSLVREWIVRVPFQNSANPGSSHEHLVARYNIRHYSRGNTKVDVVVENNWAFANNHRSYRYQAKVFINGVKRYEDNALTHFAHARWKVSLWTNEYPELHIIHDPVHLMASRVSPNYDSSLIGNLSKSLESEFDALWFENKPTVAGDLLRYDRKTTYCFKSETSSATTDCGTPDTFDLVVNGVGPMGIGVLPFRNQKSTGGRPEIAPLPKWTVMYILAQRYSYYKMMMAIADGSGSWPIHVRDDVTDRVLSIQDHPSVRINSSVQHSSGIEVCNRSADCIKPYVANAGHEPSFVFIPYVVTGDYFYLEELQFWTSYNVSKLSPGIRGGDRGLVEADTQNRERGWTLRTLTHTAYITPDNDQLKDHFLYLLKSNIDEFTDVFVSDPSRSTTFGITIPGAKRKTIAPWQDDYISWAIGNMVNMGYASAKPLALWKTRFPVKRMGFDNSNFCYIFGANYSLIVGPIDSRPLTANEENVTILHKKGTSVEPLVYFKNIDSVYTQSNTALNGGTPMDSTPFSTAEACASAAQAAETGLDVGVMKYEGATGLVAQMGPALAAAVDVGANESLAAWSRYSSRNGKPGNSSKPQWAIVPLQYADPGIDFFGENVPGYEPPSGGGVCRP